MVTKAINEKLGFTLVVIAFVCIRLLASVIYPSFPAWDPWSYYEALNTLLDTRINPLCNKSGYYMSGIVYVLAGVTEGSGLDTYNAIKWLGPLIYCIIIIPILYSMGRDFSRNSKAGLITLLLFGISDIGVLRESYTIAEGLAIPLSVIAIYSAINFYKDGRVFELFVTFIVMLCLPFVHHLTSFITFLTFVVVLASLVKTEKIRRNFAIVLVLIFASCIIFTSQAHIYLEREAYRRFSTFLEGMSNPRTPSTYEALTEKYSAVPRSFTELIYQHISTGIILLLAFITFLESAIKKIERTEEIFLYVWLIVTVAFFFISILGDYLFGWLFDFYGYRAWIFAVVPASVLAARTLLKLTKMNSLILPLIVGISVLGTSAFTIHQFDTMNYHYYEIETSDWLLDNLGNRTVIFSPGSFHPSRSLNTVPYLIKVESKDLEFFTCNDTYIEYILNSSRYRNIYVISSKRATDKPFHTAYMRICYDSFGSDLFIRIYDSKISWIWKG